MSCLRSSSSGLGRATFYGENNGKMMIDPWNFLGTTFSDVLKKKTSWDHYFNRLNYSDQSGSQLMLTYFNLT